MLQRFPLTQEDRDLARRKAENAVDLFVRRFSPRLFQREFHTRGFYVGYCAELAIARFFQVLIPPYEPYRDWDLEIPGVGKVQVKCTTGFRLPSWRLRKIRLRFSELSDISGIFLWFCYYRENDIQKFFELSPEEISKLPTEDGHLEIKFSKESWDRVEE